MKFKQMLGCLALIGCAGVASLRGEQVWTGTLSDDVCGASHQATASKKGLTARQCTFECIKGLAKYVLVARNDQVIPITNQDASGFPLYVGRPVRVTGELNNGAIVASKIEAIPAHLHLGHVMTNWRETPGNVGFLFAAIPDARVAAVHAKLSAAALNNLDEAKLHAGHVLNALDPSLELKGPGSGFGVKKAVAGALQHLEFAVKSEGTTKNIETHANHVSTSLKNVQQWVDEAIRTAQQIRSSSGDVSALAAELVRLTTMIVDGNDANRDGQIGWETGEGGLPQAQTHMTLMMKGEGLENAPR